jgi:hypothetical protein
MGNKPFNPFSLANRKSLSSSLDALFKQSTASHFSSSLWATGYCISSPWNYPRILKCYRKLACWGQFILLFLLVDAFALLLNSKHKFIQ